MCIINGPVESVSNTQLLVIPSHDRTFIAYGNSVSTNMENAMILPVPYPETVRFHDLSGIPDLFEQCKKLFPRVETRMMLSMNYSLPVINVGSYQVSLCLNSSDLDRLNTDYFIINRGIKALFRRKYDMCGVPFGYIVCKLRKGENSYHPFGYSSKSWHSKIVFVPTFHHHSGGLDEEPNAEWDHEIYSLGCTSAAGTLGSSEPTFTPTSLGLDTFPRGIRKLVISGVYRNTDLFFTCSSGQGRDARHIGIDGCVFRYTDPEGILSFEPSLLSTMPVFTVGNKEIVLAFSHTPYDPLVFFGRRVDISIDGRVITVVDEPDSDYTKTYTFDLRTDMKFNVRFQKWILVESKN